MSRVDVVLPELGVTGIEELVELARRNRHRTGRPFDAESIDFLSDLSGQLLKASRRIGMADLAPLGFFLRRSAIERLAADTRNKLPRSVVPVPRGRVFHVPPANVDTIFVYTLALSLLAGNTNVIRLSERAGERAMDLVDLLRVTLIGHPKMADALLIVRYGHEDDITTTLSANCDLRILWGGDRSIETIRRSPLPPNATDLTFPDRISLAAISVNSYLDADDGRRNELVRRFCNDAYWFDQLACSSPQQVAWIGAPGDCRTACADFFSRLELEIRSRSITVQPATSVSKMVAGLVATTHPTAQTTWYSDELVVTDGLPLTDMARLRPGSGFFTSITAAALGDIAGTISPQVQTLSAYGIPREDALGLVETLSGQGIDRIVPIGQALDFNTVWDGKDLAREMIKLVHVAIL